MSTKEDKALNAIVPQLPFCFVKPNQVLRKENREFVTRDGKHGVVTVAIYENDKGKIREMDLYVYWDVTLEQFGVQNDKNK